MKWYLNLIAAFVVAYHLAVPVYAEGPTEQIKESTDKFIAILTDPALKAPERRAEKRRLVREAVEERFDWEAISRRALGQHWKKMTVEERKEFIQLFMKLLERTYMNKIEDYSGETVSYENEKVEGKYGVVYVTFLTEKYSEIPAKYRVWNRSGKWLIYDISIKGVSLVNNYRSQFNDILMKSSPKELIERLKKKVEEG